MIAMLWSLRGISGHNSCTQQKYELMQDRYFLPHDYICNPAETFDADEAQYWDPDRADASLAYQADFYAWALSIIREQGLASIADFGCGTAAKLAWIHEQVPSLKCCGLDQPNAISLCQSQYSFGEWLQCDLDSPESLEKRCFDLIVASDVIEHLENPDNLLATMRRFATPDTLLMLSTPERLMLRGEHTRRSGNRYHVREWSQLEFSQYLESRDIEIISHRMLPAFKFTHSASFTLRALKRWARLKTIRYNQCVLARFRPVA